MPTADLISDLDLCSELKKLLLIEEVDGEASKEHLAKRVKKDL